MKYILRFFVYIQYLLIRFAGMLFDLVPAAKAYNLGASLARGLYPIFKNRRKVAVDNILQAGITAEPAEADRIARCAFGHLAGHICEALKVNQVIKQDNWREHVTLAIPENSRRLIFDELDQPLIILTGHLGVWEAALSIISFTRPMIALARKMNNPFAERYLKDRHFRGAIKIVDKNKGFTSAIIREWQETAAAMTLVMDQHAGRKTGIMVDFLGRPASTHTSPARLHLRTAIPAIVGAVVREAPFQYKFISGEPINFQTTDDKEHDIKVLLTTINQQLGDIIRDHPEQYLWAHRRWR
ncbi:MAG: lysophospholipid acyltransferase family protein [Kiritimatiellae bacterium]|nr:lysophospholipid acyltransferase family protein [Kiritimatiellia bacterium]